MAGVQAELTLLPTRRTGTVKATQVNPDSLPRSPVPSPSFAQLCLTDFFVQAQTLRSSLCHDLRYARYLKDVAPPRIADAAEEGKLSALDAIIGALEALIRRMDGLVLDGFDAELKKPEVDEKSLETAQRMRVPFRVLVEQAGVTIGDLEALVSRLPPGTAPAWARLEALDATPIRLLVKVAREVAAMFEHNSKTRPLSIELAFQDEVYAYDDLGAHDQRAPLAVVVPTRLAYAPRYSLPLVAHEVCHGAVRAWMQTEPSADKEQRHRQFAEAVGSHLQGVDNKTLTFLADEVFAETAVDALCMKMMGPAYVLAVAAWTGLRVPTPINAAQLDEAAPIAVRLRRMLDSDLTDISPEVRAMLDQIQVRLDNRQGADDTLSALPFYEDRVAEIVSSDDWLPSNLLLSASPLESKGKLHECWQRALTTLPQGTEDYTHLEDLRHFDELRKHRKWPDGMEKEGSGTSNIVFSHKGGSASPAAPKAIATLHRQSVGPVDDVFILEDFKVCAPDDWPDGYPNYLERILAVEAVKWCGHSAWNPAALDRRESGAIIEVALRRPELSAVLGHAPGGAFGDSGRVARLFRLFGWADLAILVTAPTPCVIVNLINALSADSTAQRVTWLLAEEPIDTRGSPLWAYLHVGSKESGRTRHLRCNLSSWADLVNIRVEQRGAKQRILELTIEPAREEAIKATAEASR